MENNSKDNGKNFNAEGRRKDAKDAERRRHPTLPRDKTARRGWGTQVEAADSVIGQGWLLIED